MATEFGNHLKELRRNRQMTQTQLAEALKVGQSFIAQLESSKVPGKQIVKRLVQALNLQTHESERLQVLARRLRYSSRLTISASTFGKCVTAMRKAYHFTEIELAKMVSIDLGYLSRIENKEEIPSYQVIIRLANAFHLHGKARKDFFLLPYRQLDE